MQDDVWYFAYGSNLAPETFLGRRRMRPAESRRARLDGYRIVFDVPVGPGERAVANLQKDAAGRTHGVIYRIPSAQADHLDRTEGVHRGFYERVSVCVTDDRDESIPAFTYLSERRTPGRKPSKRYIGLILRGARHHGLPESYTRALEDLDLAVDDPGRKDRG